VARLLGIEVFDAIGQRLRLLLRPVPRLLHLEPREPLLPDTLLAWNRTRNLLPRTTLDLLHFHHQLLPEVHLRLGAASADH
jgi:hypothetical protein